MPSLPPIARHWPDRPAAHCWVLTSRALQASWMMPDAVDATSHRIGFVICGDLEVAARMVSMEPVVVGGPQVKDKIKELVLYSISEDYFAVRSHLGLTIG